MGCGASSLADPWSLAAQGPAAALASWLDGGGEANAVDTLKGRGGLLHVAASNNQGDCVKVLLKHGADVNLRTPQHGTALHAAAAAGSSSVVTLLLASGACTTIRHGDKTAAEVAQQAGFPAIACFIARIDHDKQAGDADAVDSRSTEASLPPGGPALAVGTPTRAGSGSHAALSRQAQQQMQQAQQRERERERELMAAARHAMYLADQSALGSQGSDAAQPRTGSDPSQGGSPRHDSMPASHPLPGPRPSMSQSRPSPLAPHAQTQVAREAAARRPARLSRGPAPQADCPDQDLAEAWAQAAGADRGEEQARPPSRQGTSDAALDVAVHAHLLQQQSPGGNASHPDTPAAPRQLLAASASVDEAAADGSGAEGPGGTPAAQQGAAQGAAQAAAEQEGGTHRHTPSNEGLASEGSVDAEGASGASGSNSRSSSAHNSLMDDPLLKFLKRQLNSKAPSATPPSPSPQASPFASTVAAAPGTPLHGGGPPAAAANGAALSPGGGSSGVLATLPSAPSTNPSAGRTASGDSQMRTGCSSRSQQLSTALSGLSGMSSIVIPVDIRPWEIDFRDLQLQKKTIGEGSFGKVYVAKWHETLVAVKVLLDLEEAQEQSAEAAWTLSNPILRNLQKECALMASLRHPNVVQFMGVSAMPPAMITEYCARGSLNDVLRACAASPAKAAHMTWLRRLNMALDATKGCLYLHRRGIIHRDLKSPNLLVEAMWRVKVADFNLSKIVEDTSSGRSTIANMNPRWLAPEILNGEPATTASDVFSWGVVMWELMTFQCPWPHTSPWALVGKLMDGHRLAIPPRDKLPGPDTQRFVCLEDYIALMQRCWAQSPTDRPDFEEVIHELRKMLEQQARAVGGTAGA